MEGDGVGSEKLLQMEVEIDPLLLQSKVVGRLA
jgi:hypothetical protein